MSETGPLFATETVVRTATEAELDAAEAALGSPLPVSYRAFATRYGQGLANGLFAVRMPFADHGDQALVPRSRIMASTVLKILVGQWRLGLGPGTEDCLEPRDAESRLVADFLPDLVFFANSIDGHWLAWLGAMERSWLLDDLGASCGEDGAPRLGAEDRALLEEPGPRFYVIDRGCRTIHSAGDDLLAFLRATTTEAVKPLLGPGYDPLPSRFGPG
ncbi:hypothetical protein BN1110_00588 [bacterium YEK0313]|nr:hypothetical protein BN1110_00588 [bacterium YEK0313]